LEIGDKMKTIEIKEAINNIKIAISFVIDGQMEELSCNPDLWQHGIHKFMDSSRIPFDGSFDEIELVEENEYNKLEADMLVWLSETLSTANTALVESYKHKAIAWK
jgi:hypothetical protein